ncbi:hypothetical protein Lser_V15G22820 [Lactuca serriola]
MLDCPLEFEIADDQSVRASEIYRDCVLRMYDEYYLVDLVPIPLHGNKVIIGIDWLSLNGAVIDCAQQLVRVRTPSGGKLVIQGERPQREPVMCSAVRARRYLHKGCSGFFSYVMDTREKGKAAMDDVPVVREYPDDFLEDFLGIPPEGQERFSEIFKNSSPRKCNPTVYKIAANQQLIEVQ